MHLAVNQNVARSNRARGAFLRDSSMTIGIYALYWEDIDKIYVGLSQNIESRFREHKTLMRNNKHTNYLIQQTYAKYGLPEFYILEKCKVSELPIKEVYWTNEFDALNKKVGLCLVQPGIVGFGPNSNSSKYSLIQILRVFSLLYRTNSTLQIISTKLKVPLSLVADISSGATHKWLQDKYPEQYKRMQGRKKNKNTLHTKPIVVSPTGEEYIIEEYLNVFCSKQDTLNHAIKSSSVGIGKVILRKRKQYLGWTLKT